MFKKLTVLNKFVDNVYRNKVTYNHQDRHHQDSLTYPSHHFIPLSIPPVILGRLGLYAQSPHRLPYSGTWGCKSESPFLIIFMGFSCLAIQGHQ